LKSWISALFFVATAILYPGIKLGIASGKGQQARNVIIQKIKGELAKNENIAREIQFPIKISQDDCVVNFWNGSEIRAITLGNNQSGDSARSWRFNYILIDEARLVKDNIIEEILIPMTKTRRSILLDYEKDHPDIKLPPEKGKVIYISSAYLKSCDLYKRFVYHYKMMKSGSEDYFVASLSYRAGVDAGIFYEEDILKEKEKPSMTTDKFMYEYEGVFVGSSSDSYFPYDLTEKSRKLEKCELEQPSKSSSSYIIVHDVALSNAKDSDNACTTVIKLKPRPNGTYFKEVVYIKTHNGVTLQEQRDFLRELVHIKFPNAEKLVIDMRGNGEGLPYLFYETWEYIDPKTKKVIEFPPLVLDDDDEGKKLKGAIPLIRGVAATNSFNNTMYTYMKSCFEDGSVRLLIPSTEVDSQFKENNLTPDEYAVFIETDLLIEELANITQTISGSGNIIYDRLVKTMKRDRVTSLGYGLAYVNELEVNNKHNLYQDDYDNMLKSMLEYLIV